MANWRDSVDKSLKEHLELQIKESFKYSSSIEKAKNKSQAQVWIAVANLSKEIFNLELKIKFLESVLKEMHESLENFKVETIELLKKDTEKKEQPKTSKVEKKVVKKKAVKKKAVKKAVKKKTIKKKVSKKK